MTGIAVRCPFGRPAVIETSPTLAGMPNPTLLYLTCPSAVDGDQPGGGGRGSAALQSGLRRRLRSAAGPGRGRPAPTGAGAPRLPRPAIRGPRPGSAAPRARKRRRACTPTRRPCWPRWRGGLRGGAASTQPGRTGRAAAAAGIGSCPRGRRSGAPTTGARAGCPHAARKSARPRAAAPAAPRRPAAERVAAIDIGTISVRLLVADLHSGGPSRSSGRRRSPGWARGCGREAAWERPRSCVPRRRWRDMLRRRDGWALAGSSSPAPAPPAKPPTVPSSSARWARSTRPSPSS